MVGGPPPYSDELPQKPVVAMPLLMSMPERKSCTPVGLLAS